MKMIDVWLEREKPDISIDAGKLWRAFRAWAASNRWDASLPRQWVEKGEFTARIALLRGVDSAPTGGVRGTIRGEGRDDVRGAI